MGGRDWTKVIKMYKLPVIRYISTRVDRRRPRRKGRGWKRSKHKCKNWKEEGSVAGMERQVVRARGEGGREAT